MRRPRHLTPQTLHHYRPPWSRWFKTHFLRGTYGWEVQLGPRYWILQYGTHKLSRHHDPYWRRTSKPRENSLLGGWLRLGS